MKLLIAYVFLAGFTITGVEMAASRFLAPTFGTSLIIWTNVIGIILLALAFGYAIGGRIADKHPDQKHFFLLGVVGSVLLFLLPFVAQSFLLYLLPYGIHSEIMNVITTFLASLILFGIPVFFLAMLSPFAVRLASKDVKVVGSKAGTLSFWSTLGSILGIYMTSFFFIPYVGIKETMWVFAALLFVPSVLMLPKKKVLSLIGISVFGISSLLYPVDKAFAYGTLQFETESVYQHIKVSETENGMRYLFFNEGVGIQSVYHPEKILTDLYYDYYLSLLNLARFEEKEELNVLILGYAGGTIGKLFHTFTPEGMTIHIDGVEIDPTVTELSKTYFGVTEEERDIYNMDGRSFLYTTEKDYDIIIVDAYSQEIYIPPHMITVEFFEQLREALTTEGVISFNLNSLGTDSPLFQATAASMEEANIVVRHLSIPDSLNFMVMGTKDGKPFGQRATTEETAIPFITYFLEFYSFFERSPDALLFTDNKSPIETLIHGDIFEAMFGE